MNSKLPTKKDPKGTEPGRSYLEGSGDKAKEARTQSSEGREEFEFALPTFPLLDKVHLQTYSSILNKNGCATMEDLDQLQPELEILFTFAVLRANVLKTELANLANAEENKYDIRTTSSVMYQKKKKLSDARLSKSLQDLSRIRGRVLGIDFSSENDTDNSADLMLTDLPLEPTKVSVPKNDLPYQFWKYVEPYAKGVTSEGMQDLDDMIQSCERSMLPLAIPPLGRHYSTTRAEEELHQEQATSNPRRRVAPYVERTPGPLVSRVVSALIADPSNDPFYRLDSDSETYQSAMKDPSFHASASFERRLKRELEAVGFLDSEPDEDDEILAEIKSCNEELRKLAAQNKAELELLKEKAKKQLRVQEIVLRIEYLNKEINDMQRKNSAAKLKKKTAEEERERYVLEIA